MLFADPLVVTVSDAIVVDHPPLGQASVSRLLDNVVGATMPDKVDHLDLMTAGDVSRSSQ